MKIVIAPPKPMLLNKGNEIIASPLKLAPRITPESKTTFPLVFSIFFTASVLSSTICNSSLYLDNRNKAKSFVIASRRERKMDGSNCAKSIYCVKMFKIPNEIIREHGKDRNIIAPDGPIA